VLGGRCMCFARDSGVHGKEVRKSTVINVRPRREVGYKRDPCSECNQAKL
jgi:hypothetical protein